MELGKQIKKYRRNFSLSQEDLAEKVYVAFKVEKNRTNGAEYRYLGFYTYRWRKLLQRIWNTARL